MTEQNENSIVQQKEKSPEFGITVADAERALKGIRQFQHLVRTLMVAGVDYGTIPGTNKPTLFKPGAEKTVKLLKLADTYEFMDKISDYDKPFFAFTIKCQLKMYGTEIIISEGIGSCNSYESKYKFRWAYEKDIPEGFDKNTLTKKTFSGKGGSTYCKYRIDNDDICSVANTVLKMAKKRALVDAALSAGRLSEIFTQDIDDDDLVEGMDMPPAQPIKIGVEGLKEKINKKKDEPPAEPPDPEFQKKAKEQSQKLKTAPKPKDYCPYCKGIIDPKEQSTNKSGEQECNVCGYVLVERP